MTDDAITNDAIADAADPRAMLREAVVGQDDAALIQFAENLGGVEAFLDLTFQGMQEAVDAEKAQDCVIGWEVKHGDDVHPYTVTIEGGEVSAERREPEGARVTLNLSLPDYMRLVAGELDGMQAFMAGKLQLKGDMMFAAQIQEMFTA